MTEIENGVEFVYLTVDDVIALHDAVIDRHTPTEPHDLLNRGLLESSVAQPQQAFGGQRLYPSLPDAATAYLLGLALNHCFQNGNKRIALAACSVFLRINGYRLTFTQNEAEYLVIDTILHSLSREDAAMLIASAIEAV